MSPDLDSDVIVVVARRSSLVPLTDVLRDWSSVGLLRPVHLVDADSLKPGEIYVPCTVLQGGAVRGAVLQEALAARERTGVVRFCAITESTTVVAGVEAGEALMLQERVRSALPGVKLVPLHIISVAHGAAPPGDETGWLGWHNIVIAPENSRAPTQGVAPIVYRPDDPVRLTHLAASTVSLAGLWLAIPTGPLDDRPLPPGRTVVAARSFSRHLSAAAVESQLLGRLADVGSGYPVPVFEGSSAWVVEDEVAAVTDMADAVLRKHAYVLPSLRQAPRRTPPRSISALEGLRMLFAFLGQALRNAPRAFLERAVNEVSARTARVVSGAVFGDKDPEYSIVVRGVRPDGLLASWADVDEALGGVADRMSRADVVHRSNADLSSLWKDFVAAGLTLIDAGARSADLPPRMLGARRGVVTAADRIAPSATEVFRPPEDVAPYIVQQGDRVAASHDVLGARELDEQLREVAEREPHVRGRVTAARAELAEWATENARSYTGRVGTILGDALQGVRTEITTLAKALRAAQQAADVPSPIVEEQLSLASKLKWILISALVLASVAVALTVIRDDLDWVFLVSVLGAIVLVWLVASLVVFLQGQRDLFALLHQRRESADQVELLRRHFTDALEDMRRVARAYRQYLDWTRAFSRFVHAPLGQPSTRTDEELLLGSGLPRNHRLGSSQPDRVVLDEAAARMKPHLFTVGWASEAWGAFLDDLPAELGPDAFRLREDPDLLWADAGVSRRSVLTTWAEAISGRTQWEGATESLGVKVGGALRGQEAALTPRLLANVQSRSSTSGAVESVSYESFMNGLDAAPAVLSAAQGFDRGMFVDRAQNAEPWRVADSVVGSSTANLSRTIVVTQLSQGFTPYDLDLGSATPAAPSSARDQSGVAVADGVATPPKM